MVYGWRWVGKEIGCTREMADALWKGHTLLKTGLSAHRHTHRQTDKVKTVYPPDYAKPATIGHNRPNVIEMLDLGSCIYFTHL